MRRVEGARRKKLHMVLPLSAPRWKSVCLPRTPRTRFGELCYRPFPATVSPPTGTKGECLQHERPRTPKRVTGQSVGTVVIKKIFSAALYSSELSGCSQGPRVPHLRAVPNAYIKAAKALSCAGLSIMGAPGNYRTLSLGAEERSYDHVYRSTLVDRKSGNRKKND